MKEEKAEINRTLKVIAKSSVIVFIAIFLSKLFTYIYRIIIARNFGPAEYGLFTLSIMITGWFIAFSSFGLNQGLVRFISIFRGKNEAHNIKYTFQSSLKVSIISSFIACAILLLFSDLIANSIFGEPELKSFLIFFSTVIPLTVILEIFLAVVLAYEDIGWYSFIHQILIGVIKIVLILVLLFAGFKLGAIFFSFIASMLGALVISIILLKKKYAFIFEKAIKQKDTKVLKELYSYSWPLLFYGLVWQIFHWTDSFAIGLLKTATDVGLYNAAVPIAFLLTATSQIFMQLFFPIINKEHARKNDEVVSQLSKQVGKWIFMANLPVFLLLVFFPKQILNLLFGSEYLAASNSLILLGIGTIIFSVFSVSNRLIAMSGRSKIIMLDIIVVFIINLVLNFLLIPKFGIDGAALATMISFIILSLISMMQSMKYSSIIPLRKKMINLILAGAISSILLFYLSKLFSQTPIGSAILIIIFVLSYLFFAFVLRGFDQNDTMVLKAALKKTGFSR